MKLNFKVAFPKEKNDLLLIKEGLPKESFVKPVTEHKLIVQTTLHWCWWGPLLQ